MGFLDSFRCSSIHVSAASGRGSCAKAGALRFTRPRKRQPFEQPRPWGHHGGTMGPSKNRRLGHGRWRGYRRDRRGALRGGYSPRPAHRPARRVELQLLSDRRREVLASGRVGASHGGRAFNRSTRRRARDRARRGTLPRADAGRPRSGDETRTRRTDEFGVEHVGRAQGNDPDGSAARRHDAVDRRSRKRRRWRDIVLAVVERCAGIRLSIVGMMDRHFDRRTGTAGPGELIPHRSCAHQHGERDKRQNDAPQHPPRRCDPLCGHARTCRLELGARRPAKKAEQRAIPDEASTLEDLSYPVHLDRSSGRGRHPG
jgi:hypothetical protein